MSTRYKLIAMAIAPLTLLLGTLAMANKSSDLSCEIRSSPSGSGLLLEAVATGSRDATGEYEFVVAKSGGGGSSNVTQGGDFEVSAGEVTILGEVTLGPGEGSSVKAVLKLIGPGGETLCESRLPNRS